MATHRRPLTSLANRRRLTEVLATAIGAPPGADNVHALFMIDLNGFKHINDVYGHAAGDQALVTVGQRLLEGIEHEEQESWPLSSGCEQGQSYPFGKAMSARDALALLTPVNDGNFSEAI